MGTLTKRTASLRSNWRSSFSVARRPPKPTQRWVARGRQASLGSPQLRKSERRTPSGWPAAELIRREQWPLPTRHKYCWWGATDCRARCQSVLSAPVVCEIVPRGYSRVVSQCGPGSVVKMKVDYKGLHEHPANLSRRLYHSSEPSSTSSSSSPSSPPL
jgi:hypothetical protein